MLGFSEFGRRVAENSSAGTDHGTAGLVFLAGPGVRSGVHGKVPSLTDLVDGDPKITTDFRRVYASVLEQWLGLPSRTALGIGLRADGPLPGGAGLRTGRRMGIPVGWAPPPDWRPASVGGAHPT